MCDVGKVRDVLLASKLLASDGPISVDSLYDYITNNQDKVLLILDGYDEYSCAKEHSPILEIWKGEQLRDCHVIVTTRQLKCDELIGLSHVQLEIQGFKSWKRKRTFARKFLAGEQDLDEFMSYLEEKDLVDMAEIPLLLQISSSRECQGFANPESESLNLEPAFDFHENSRCKIAEGAKHSYRRYFSHNKSRRFGAEKIQQRQRTDHLADRCGCHGPPIQPRGESLPTPGHEERDA